MSEVGSGPDQSVCSKEVPMQGNWTTGSVLRSVNLGNQVEYFQLELRYKIILAVGLTDNDNEYDLGRTVFRVDYIAKVSGGDP